MKQPAYRGRLLGRIGENAMEKLTTFNQPRYERIACAFLPAFVIRWWIHRRMDDIYRTIGRMELTRLSLKRPPG